MSPSNGPEINNFICCDINNAALDDDDNVVNCKACLLKCTSEISSLCSRQSSIADQSSIGLAVQHRAGLTLCRSLISFSHGEN